MKGYLILLLIICLSCSTKEGNKNQAEASEIDTIVAHAPDSATAKTVLKKSDTTISVLVLPAYDEIANGGASPDTQRILEKILSKHDTLKVLSFRLKILMGTPYHMVYDKQYCLPILKKIPSDIVVMSRIITKNEHEPGIWPWAYEVKIYNTLTGKQLKSIGGKNLKAEEFVKDISNQRRQLIRDIFNSFN
jgi:hypothetical protein